MKTEDLVEGNIYKVTDCLYGHDFSIGQEVRLKEIWLAAVEGDGGLFEGLNGNGGSWALSIDEVEPV